MGDECRTTVVVLAKDEERCIARCLDSVVGRGLDVLVVDTGSTDGTVDVVDGYRNRGVRLVREPWRDSFAGVRNAAMDVVGSGWVVFLDADEWLTERSSSELLPRLAALSADSVGTAFAPTITDSASGAQVDEVPRIFRAEGPIRFKGVVHEYPVVDGVDPVDLVALDVEFLHDGYTPTVLAEKKKSERNLALLTAARAQDPEDPRWPYFMIRNPLSVLGNVDIAELCDAIGVLAEHGVRTGDRRTGEEYHRLALALACQGLALRGDWRTVDRYCAELDRVDQGESPDAHYFRSLFELAHGVVTERDLQRTVKLRKNEALLAKSTLCPDGRHLDALVVALLARRRGVEMAHRYRALCDPWSDVFFERSLLREAFVGVG